VVSRDRASAFAEAVSQVLPHATQVADRYHLVQNLREHLQRLLDHKRSCLPLVEDTALKSIQAGHPGKADPLADLTLSTVSDSILKTLSSEQYGERTCPEADLSGLTYAEREARRSAGTSALLTMRRSWLCTERAWGNVPLLAGFG
jgi:hypothetical protein